MIRLEPFTQNDFEVFKSWIHNKEELFQFAGPIFSYPLTDDQLNAYVQMSDKKPLKVILNATNEVVGHGELNFSNGNNRLSRILVGNKNLRGQKIGEQIIRKMADLLFQDPHVDVIDLNTFQWNISAIKCYEKVGFKIDHDKSDEMIVNGKKWTRINMVLNRNDR